MTEAVEIPPRRTDPRGFVLHALEGLRGAVLPVAGGIFSTIDDGMSTMLLVSGVIGGGALILSAVIAYLRWTRLTYSVDRTDIRVESGVLSRQVRSVPFERIQDVATSQGFIARLFGLVELTFDTGAGSGEDISLSYLGEDEGERLRQLIRDRQAEGGAAPIAAQEQGASDRILFAMTPRRVLLAGVFNFSLVAIAAVGGFLAQYDEILPFDIWDIEGWRDRLAGPGAWLAGLGVVAQAIGVAALLAFLGIFGVVTGIVRAALAEWNFRLERTEKGFRRRRGMFTRTDVTLPVRRVQAAIVAARTLEARFGWRSALLVSLAADAGASNHEIAPLAKWDEIAPLVEEAGLRIPHDNLGWGRISRIHAWGSALDRLKWWFLIALAIAIAQYVVSPDGWLGNPWLSAIPVVIGLWKAFRTLMALLMKRYAMDEEQLYVESGWLSRTLELVPREKLHSISIGQGPLARRFGFAYLNMGVAGTHFSVQGLPLPRARSMRAALLESMQRRDFSRIN